MRSFKPSPEYNLTLYILFLTYIIKNKRGIHLTIKTIDDQTFLTQIENLTLDKIYFNHVGHLRLAWLYLESYETDIAVNKTCQSIKAYAESLGARQKFNKTITDALVRIMAKRKAGLVNESWSNFIKTNTDLVEDAFSVLLQYYSKERLLSEEARLSVVSADIKEIS